MANAPLPFRAALIDLDGTLLDSMHVWRGVDAQFFAQLGMAVPEDYSRALQGKSFRESAEYTVRRFALPQTPDQVMAQWMAMTAEAYAHDVALKPGARRWLRRMKRAGVKLAVATANRPSVFVPTLERWGVLPLFDALCTTADVGDRGKADGALFRHAAAQLGVAEADCAVFEDTLEGIRGAKACGMKAYCIEDAASAHNLPAIQALADGVAADFYALEALCPVVPGKERCVIFTARCEGDPARAYQPREGDTVLCADGGWQIARAVGVTPDAVLGDFDSASAPRGLPAERFPVEKDDTDTLLCLKRGLAMGFEDFLIIGGFGGRLDHTLANLQALNYAASQGARAQMDDGKMWASVIRGGEALRVAARPGKLSVFALDAQCGGVDIAGAKYALQNGTLTNAFPLGVSNEFAAPEVEIKVDSGALLVLAGVEE